MGLNTGWIDLFCSMSDGSSVHVRVRYDETKPRPGQPIINDPALGAALICDNTSTGTAKVIVTGPDQVPHTVPVPPGTTKLSAAQLAAFGVTTRDQAQVSLSCP